MSTCNKEKIRAKNINGLKREKNESEIKKRER
jgi:hypothetical protein